MSDPTRGRRALRHALSVLAACAWLASPVAAATSDLSGDRDDQLLTCTSAVIVSEVNSGHFTPTGHIRFDAAVLSTQFTLMSSLSASKIDAAALQDRMGRKTMAILAEKSEAGLMAACRAKFPSAFSDQPVTLPADADDRLLACGSMVGFATGQFIGLSNGKPYAEAAPYQALFDRLAAAQPAWTAARRRKRAAGLSPDMSGDILAHGRLDKALDACVVAYPEGWSGQPRPPG